MIADKPILLRYGNSPELQQLVHITEFALKKNNSIRVKSFNDACPECLRLYYFPDGESDWLIDSENYIFYRLTLQLYYPGIYGMNR